VAVADPVSAVAQVEGKRETRRIAATLPARVIGNVDDDDPTWHAVHAVTAMTHADSVIAVRTAAAMMVMATRRGLNMHLGTALKSVASAVQYRVTEAYDSDGQRVYTHAQKEFIEDEDCQRRNRVICRTDDSSVGRSSGFEIDIPELPRESESESESESEDMGSVFNDPLMHSYWVEQSRMDTPRYLQVVSSRGNFVTLKCVGCPTDAGEIGLEQEAERAVLEFSGGYVRVVEDDLEADGVEVQND
jgi:hypothetical protein